MVERREQHEVVEPADQPERTDPELSEPSVVAPGLIQAQMDGYIRLHEVERLMFAANDEIRLDRRVALFVDAFGAVGYEAECRKIFQTWAHRNRASIEGVWVLYSSPLIKMGASLVSAYTGGLVHAIPRREDWDRLLAGALESAHATTFVSA